jgi:hypothetical protein
MSTGCRTVGSSMSWGCRGLVRRSGFTYESVHILIYRYSMREVVGSFFLLLFPPLFKMWWLEVWKIRFLDFILATQKTSRYLCFFFYTIILCNQSDYYIYTTIVFGILQFSS